MSQPLSDPPTKDELLRLSETDPCPCGSGFQFGACCWRIRSENWSLGAEGAYLNHAEVFNTTPLDEPALIEELRRFDPRYLAAILSRITVILADEYRSQGFEVEFAVLRHFLEPTLFKRVAFWLRTRARATVFHRLFVPEALRLLLSNTAPPKDEARVLPHPYLLGELFLKFNDVLEPGYAALREQVKDEAELRAINLATTWRYGFFYHEENLGSAMGRSWAIYTEGFDEVLRRKGGFPFNVEFEKAFGFTVLDVMSLGFAITSRYLQGPVTLIEQADRHAITPAYYNSLSRRMRALVPVIFRYLGRIWEEHRALMMDAVKKDRGNYLQVFSLYDYPMLSLDGVSYFPLDKDFLSAALGPTGPFWKLAEKVAPRFTLMRDFFGHVFEWYVARVLQDYSHHGSQQVVWTDWAATLPKQKGRRSVDAIIRDGRTLFFVEATASVVPPQTTISCDWKKIEKKLVELWFSPDRETGRDKLKQIAGAMAAFDEESLQLDGVARADIDQLVPVLLTPGPIPQHERLFVRYRELCQEHGLSVDFAKTLVILDIEDLESLLGAFHGVQGWERAFQEMRDKNLGTGSMNDYIVANGLNKERPARVQAWLVEASERYHQMLFGTATDA